MTVWTDRPLLGIDLGGTKILTAVVSSQGAILSRDHSITPADKGPRAVIEAIVGSTRQALDQAGITLKDLGAVGIGAPGPSNPRTGILFSSPNLPGWKDVPLKTVLEEKLGSKAFLINDGNAAALAEYHFGAGQGACCFIYVTVSTGIGGGIVLGGEVYSGALGTAGEIGHMTIDHNGPICNCGNAGCWETLASGTAIAREARRRISQGRPSTLLDYTGGDIEAVNAEVIHQAAQAGDELAQALVAQTSQYLGTGFANLINLFNPDVIALGGGMANMGAALLQPAYAAAGQRAFRQAFEAVRFVPAALGRNSGVLGAAVYAYQQLQTAS